MTKLITIWDTSVGTLNVGDEIINESVKRELSSIYQDGYQFFTVPTHDIVGRRGKLILNKSEASFVAGTNILSSRYKHFRSSNGWNLRYRDAFLVRDVILFGVGWENYQSKPSFTNKFLYQHILNKTVIHSVRDNHTKKMLESIGITNVVNTGCPTLWRLVPEHCKTIPHTKAKKVITTVTDYRKDKAADELMLKSLNENYEEVYIWLQGAEDEPYFDGLDASIIKNIKKIPGSLQKYDEYLEDPDFEFVGTRLHAGIRAMQKGRRAVIIGVDNRSIEMKRDWDLPVLERENIAQLSEYINHDFETKINLDFDLIEKWKAQFKHE
ncbi:MAG: polysaccharide pyruvyl transferase family protein [Lactococcus sp.]